VLEFIELGKESKRFSMTNEANRITASVRGLLLLAQFMRNPNMVWLAMRELGRADLDDSCERVLRLESRSDGSSTGFVHSKLPFKTALRHLKDTRCKVATLPAFVSDLESKKKVDEAYDLHLGGLRVQCHRIGPRVLRRTAKLDYIYHSSLYVGTAPSCLVGDMLKFPELLGMARIRNDQKTYRF